MATRRGLPAMKRFLAALLVAGAVSSAHAQPFPIGPSGSGPCQSGISWTPTDQSGATLTFTAVSAKYCQIGNLVFAYGTLTYPSTADGSNAKISLPVAVPNQTYAVVQSGTVVGAAVGTAFMKTVQGASAAAMVTGANVAVVNSSFSAKTITFIIIYPAS